MYGPKPVQAMLTLSTAVLLSSLYFFQALFIVSDHFELG